MNYLIDTCVISELVARQPARKVVQWIDSIDSQRLYLSVITIGEIRKGIEKLPGSKRKTELYTWLQEELLSRFGGRILAIDTAVMMQWGRLAGALDSTGRKMSAMDSLIAATSLHHQMIVVTRNEDDFRYAGVTILNPWKNADDEA